MIDIEITYIHHSSFMAKFDHAVLLFDHFEGNIPGTDREKPLFVFASHRHGDRFSRSVFGLEESRGNVICVLSDDIWIRQVPEDPLDRTMFLEPGEEVSPRNGTENSADIQTFKFTNEGMALLVSLEHGTIYHAGDLNNWVWEGGPEVDDCKMSESLYRGMDKLAGRHTDVVFMLVDPRQEKDSHLGIDDFMRMVRADVMFPMHLWGDFQAAARFRAPAYTGGYRDGIQEIHRRGEGFLV